MAKNENGSSSGSLRIFYDESVLLPLAAAVCAVPSTVIGVPADVLKKHLVLGKDPSFGVALRNILTSQGWYHGLFAGWHVNLIRDIPFACVKVGLYELFVTYYKQYQGLQKSDKLSTFGTAFCGVTSGVSCAVLTAPLDVVNTRIKAGDTILHPRPSSAAAAATAYESNKLAKKKIFRTSIHRQTQQSTSILYVGRNIVAKEGIAALFRGVLMRSFVLGVGSVSYQPTLLSNCQMIAVSLFLKCLVRKKIVSSHAVSSFIHLFNPHDHNQHCPFSFHSVMKFPQTEHIPQPTKLSVDFLADPINGVPLFPTRISSRRRRRR